VQGSTLQFNRSLTEADIAGLRAADPTAAPSEWLGTFREDAAAYLDDELIEHATDYSRPLELPPRPDVYYVGFTDAAGGVGQDAYTLAIGHKKGEQYFIDLVRGTTGKFDPQAATLHFAAVCKEYNVRTVIGDSYTALWVSGAWHASGVKYERSELNKSQIYLEALPLFARHLVRMPNHPKLLKELRLLDLYNHRGGRQTVDHPRGAHDDHANAVCGCLRALSNSSSYNTNYRAWNGEPSDWLTLRNYYYVASGGTWVPW
jgi:hypothetical protein